MTKRKIAPVSLPSGGLLLTMIMALFVVGIVAAESQLPGTALTTHSAHDLRPAWSPDGTQIAFHSARSGNNDVWIMAADGTNQRQLTNDPADDRRPAWSSNGAWIAFDSDRSGNRDVWVMDTNGENLTQLTADAGQDTFPAWSPDTTQIAFFSYTGGVLDLWVVDLQSFLEGGQAGEPQRLTNGLANERQNQCTFACHTPGWSPDGQLIAYPALNNTQIWLIGADGSDPRQVSGGGNYEHFPTWTSEGRIIFLSERITDQQEPVNDVWVMDADGKNATLLYPAIPHGGPLEFRPDGATIAFQSPRAGNFDIYTTVLGQEQAASTVAAPTVPAPAPGASQVEPTAVAAAVVAPVAQAEGGPNAGFIGVVALVALAAAAGVFYLLRRGRSS